MASIFERKFELHHALLCHVSKSYTVMDPNAHGQWARPSLHAFILKELNTAKCEDLACETNNTSPREYKCQSILTSRNFLGGTLGSGDYTCMCTASCSSTRNPAQPIRFEILYLLLSKAQHVARAHVAGHACIVVICDIFTFHENNSLHTTSPDTSFLLIEGCGTRDYLGIAKLHC